MSPYAIGFLVSIILATVAGSAFVFAVLCLALDKDNELEVPGGIALAMFTICGAAAWWTLLVDVIQTHGAPH